MEILNFKREGLSEVTSGLGSQGEQLWEMQHEEPETLGQCRFVITWDKKMSGGLVHVLTKWERLFVVQGAQDDTLILQA